jgi:hypothetical protein
MGAHQHLAVAVFKASKHLLTLCDFSFPTKPLDRYT